MHGFIPMMRLKILNQVVSYTPPKARLVEVISFLCFFQKH